MPINPVQFAHNVCDEFLRYLFSAFPLSDPELADQARKLLEERAVGDAAKRRQNGKKLTAHGSERSAFAQTPPCELGVIEHSSAGADYGLLTLVHIPGETGSGREIFMALIRG